jgi:uncharacterized protein YjbI with pentapeptide repeats
MVAKNGLDLARKEHGVPSFDSDDEFDGQRFENYEAAGLVIDGKEFSDCHFVGGRYANAEFRRCKLFRCTFSQCDLSNIRLNGSSLRTVSFAHAKLLGIDWTEASALVDLDLRHCVTNYGNFSQLRLPKLIMTDCVAHEVDFSGANLTDAQLSGTDLRGAVIAGTNLSKADFRGASGYSFSPVDNVVSKARFSMPEALALLEGLGIVIDV